jgi:hypothetical protein
MAKPIKRVDYYAVHWTEGLNDRGKPKMHSKDFRKLAGAERLAEQLRTKGLKPTVYTAELVSIAGITFAHLEKLETV